MTDQAFAGLTGEIVLDEVVPARAPWDGVLKRGQTLDQAHEVYRGQETDVSVSPYVLRDPDGQVMGVIAHRGVTFFESEHYLITPKGAASNEPTIRLADRVLSLLRDHAGAGRACYDRCAHSAPAGCDSIVAARCLALAGPEPQRPMRRSHRTAHRALWPLLALAVGLGLGLALLLRPPPDPVAEPVASEVAR